MVCMISMTYMIYMIYMQAKVRTPLIKRHGRWSSDAGYLYIYGRWHSLKIGGVTEGGGDVAERLKPAYHLGSWLRCCVRVSTCLSMQL